MVLSGDTVDTVDYPEYVGVPFSQTMESLISISSTTEVSPGVYECTHTIEDYWDFDDSTGILSVIEVQSYDPLFADLSVIAP